MGVLSTHFTCKLETPPPLEAPSQITAPSTESPAYQEVLLLTAPPSLPCHSPSQVAQDQALRQGAVCQQEQSESCVREKVGSVGGGRAGR